MKKTTLSKSDIKKLNENILELYNVENYIHKKDMVVKIDDKFIEINKKVSFFYVENNLIPTLKTLQEKNYLKTVTVDMGAIKFVVGGADIMRPGIVEYDDVIADEFVAIVDVNNKKPISVGKMMYSKEELDELNSGKVIKNIHFVGDDIWNSQ